VIDVDAEGEGGPARVRPRPAFRTALAFGLAAGFAELLLLVARVELQEGGFFLRSRHFVWMVPASVTAILAGLGAVGWVAVRVSDRAWRWVLGSYVFTAVLGWFLLMRGLEAIACGLIALGVAWRVAPKLEARSEGLRRWAGRGLPVFAAVLACLAAASFLRDAREASWRRGDVAPPPGARDVLLVVLDTVRADHLSLYGYDRDTTPYLKRLARESTVFDQARAGASWTLPSHATMFTGRWPMELGVERLGWLDDAAPTLAERFRDDGFDTAGFVANPFFTGRESGLGRGFQVYDDYPITPGEVFRSSALGWLTARSWLRLRSAVTTRRMTGGMRDVDLDFARKDAATVGREFLSWLDGRGGRDRPYFAFLNLFDAHDPYIPPEGFPFRFAAGSRSDTPRLLRDWQRVDKGKLTPRDVRRARDAYDDCLAALDAQLGALIEALRSRGTLDRTVLIVTADHGEQFGEHGSFGHGLSLFDEELRVPLLVRAPGLAPAGRVVAEAVGLRDLAATALDLSSATAPSLPGRTLAGAWSDPPAAVSPAFAEIRGRVGERYLQPDFDDLPGSWKSVVVDGWSYIRRGDGEESLYELAADPRQQTDRRHDPAAAAALDACRRAMDDAPKDR